MICKFSDVSERDMDMLFLEEFACSKNFLQIFLSKIEISDVEVVEIEHSKTDVEFGESDITIIIRHEGKQIALLIEDKIDAIAMPNQYERYVCRGERGIQNGDYAEFYVFIIAPQKYLSENSEAKKYPYQITYEECLEYFECVGDKRASFKIQQIKSAIHKQKSGYQVIESEAATAFWKRYTAYQKEHYPQLCITNSDGQKSARMKWVYYSISLNGVHLIHKTDKGFVDLEFAGIGEAVNLLQEQLTILLGDLQLYSAGVFRTGKSAVLRIQVPELTFKTDFAVEQESLRLCYQAITILSECSKQLPINFMTHLFDMTGRKKC